jgi:hypothetical protein
MPGIQPSSLSDEEFLSHVNLLIDKSGLLPQEVINELALRAKSGGRDKQKSSDALNPNQLPLPFDAK